MQIMSVDVLKLERIAAPAKPVPLDHAVSDNWFGYFEHMPKALNSPSPPWIATRPTPSNCWPLVLPKPTIRNEDDIRDAAVQKRVV